MTRLWLAVGVQHAALDPSFGIRTDARGEAEAREIVRRMLADADMAAWLWQANGGPAEGLVIVRIGRAPGVALEPERAEISDLFVEPDARRHGIGRQLVDAALDWVRQRGIGRVSVRVLVGNEPGQAFWRAIGFADQMDVLQRRL